MLTDEQLEVISKALVPLFNYLEQEVIKDVARRVRKTLTYTRTAELMAMDMRELGYSPDKIRKEVFKTLAMDKDYKKIVEENTIQYKQDIKELVENIVKQATEEGDDIVANSGTMAWVDDLGVWESGHKKLTDKSFLPTLTKAMQKSVREQIVDLAHSTGFKSVSGWEPIENLYRTELNKAIMKMASGSFSPSVAIVSVIATLSQSGLRSVDYKSGRSLQLDNGVILALRTGAHQLSGEICKENIKNTGENLVYVSTHWGARNKGEGVANHEEWQGKVYFIKPPTHSLGDEAKRIHQEDITDLWVCTGYSADDTKENNPLGLYGYNCRHKIYPFFEGASAPPKDNPEPPPQTINGKEYDYYEMTQRMRQMERGIRNLKRELEAVSIYSKAYPGDELAEVKNRLKAKIKTKTREYEVFCLKCGIMPNSANLRYEVGTGDLRKTQAYKEYQRMIKDSL